MSGGHFNYGQTYMADIADKIDELIINNGKEDVITDNYFECEYYYNYSPETIELFKEGIIALRKAFVYAQRIDWLVSGDDGEETFAKRLKEELDKLEGKLPTHAKKR